MKTAILTGASSGLGIQFARQLKRVFPEVEELWLIARRQDRLEALAAELTDLKTVVLPLDRPAGEAGGGAAGGGAAPE